VEAGVERLEALLRAARRRSFGQRLRDRWEFARCLVSFGRFALRRRIRRLTGRAGSGGPGEGTGPVPERSFLRNSVTTFLASLFGVGVGVVQSAIIARILMPEGKGELAAAVMIPQLAATLAPLGINWACTYHLGRRTFDREILIRSALTALLLVSAAGVVASLVAGQILRDSILAGVSRPAFLLALLTLPTSVTLLGLSGLFRGEMRIAEANRMDVARTMLMFLAILLFVAGVRLGAAGVILAQLVAEAVVAVRAFRRFGVPLVPLLRWDVIRSLTGYGLQIYSFSILLYLNYRFDLFLVRQRLDLAQTGLYATAVSLAEMLWMVPNSLGIVLFPSVARATGEERDRLALAVCRNSFWLMLLLCGSLAVGRHAALRVFFGAPFVAAAPALLAILPGILAMSVQQVLGSALSGRGRPLPVTLGAALGFGVNVVLNLLWIPRYGIVGASLASSVSYLLVAGVVLVAFLRISGHRWHEAFQLGREDWRRITGALGRLREAVA
jgi:O-antigen/teichoic acid export membrane protein